MKEIAEIAEKVLRESAVLQIKGISGGSMQLLAYKIAEHINANFDFKPRKAWFGVDIDRRISQLKQQIAMAYAYKKRIEKGEPIETKTDTTLFQMPE